MGNISLDQLGALVAFSLLLMLAWRNIRAFDMPKRRMAGYALIWLGVFFTLALVAAAFLGQAPE